MVETKELVVELTLESDVIFRESAATEGTPRTLDYVPGSALLGAAAKSLYTKLKPDLAFEIFHSGSVRFKDGLPLVGGERCLPVPLSWYVEKGTTLKPGDNLADKGLVNTAAPGVDPRPPGYEQVRRGYFAGDGTFLDPKRVFRLKTSIDRESGGKPRTAHLFGYEALCAGTRWRAAIHVDLEQGESKSVLDMLGGLFNGGLLWLGKSRGAEYGMARARVVSTSTVETAGTGGDDETNALLVFLESDAAFREPVTGIPVLYPAPSMLGLPGDWRLVPARSSIMTRRYSPYNGYRHRRDPERQVLIRGSVLAFEGETNVSISKVSHGLSAGVGFFKQDGLGCVHVQPSFLAEYNPRFKAREAGGNDTSAGKGYSPPPKGLGEWMVTAADRADAEQVIYSISEKVTKSIVGYLKKVEVPPARSQWNHVAGRAKAEFASIEPSWERLCQDLNSLLASGVTARVWKGIFPELKNEIEGGVGSDVEEPDLIKVGCMAMVCRYVVQRLKSSDAAIKTGGGR